MLKKVKAWLLEERSAVGNLSTEGMILIIGVLAAIGLGYLVTTTLQDSGKSMMEKITKSSKEGKFDPNGEAWKTKTTD
ncbi:hypothetical protein [Caldalkalibacillus mannanilyticus]|uniref:hypothetical protein n=1 Tax=Caldalkalibacillus mannanilyticus TaxID=1418 RepID=UPI00046ACABD|nr:hypothetical protein [Caldalkalibacillus mannanilyticus]